MGKKKTTIPENETKKVKFKRLCQPRVNKAIKAIELIGNCAGAGYEYTPDDVALIIATLAKTLEQLSATFASKGVDTGGFKF